jgi:hypothetical protein
MNNEISVAVQPCGDSDALSHYTDTILNPVPASRILPFLTEAQKSAFQMACGDEVAVWGVTPGKKLVNKRKWGKIKSNDVALLYKQKMIFSQGRITLAINNKDLALDLWKTNAEGDTWEYVYFLDDLQEIEIPISQYNQMMGFAENYIIQGFNVYTGEKAKVLLDLLEVDDVVFEAPSPTPVDYGTTAKRLSEIQKLTTSSISKARAEAGPLRDYLFGGKKTDHCDLCGKELPVRLLVAAHIKKRSCCTDEEKRDPHVVMRACKLGCDDLYEHGYIYVDQGGVIKNNSKVTVTSDLESVLGTISGTICKAYKLEAENYFAWHREHPKRI